MSRTIHKVRQARKKVTSAYRIKLYYKIVADPASLSVFIAYMDSKFQGRDYMASNGQRIASASHPELADDMIFLWGISPDSNNIIRTRAFATISRLQKYFEKLYVGLEIWAKDPNLWSRPSAYKEPIDLKELPVPFAMIDAPTIIL